MERPDVSGEKVQADGAGESGNSMNRLVGSQQIAYLHIELFVLLLPDEINLPAADFTDGDGVAAAQQLHVDDVFKNEVDVLHLAREEECISKKKAAEFV